MASAFSARSAVKSSMRMTNFDRRRCLGLVERSILLLAPVLNRPHFIVLLSVLTLLGQRPAGQVQPRYDLLIAGVDRGRHGRSRPAGRRRHQGRTHRCRRYHREAHARRGHRRDRPRRRARLHRRPHPRRRPRRAAARREFRPHGRDDDRRRQLRVFGARCRQGARRDRTGGRVGELRDPHRPQHRASCGDGQPRTAIPRCPSSTG